MTRRFFVGVLFATALSVVASSTVPAQDVVQVSPETHKVLLENEHVRVLDFHAKPSTAAAGGTALVNSLGSLSGWVDPSVVGWLEDITGRTATGLYVVAGLVVLGALLILLFMPRRRVAGEPTRSQEK